LVAQVRPTVQSGDGPDGTGGCVATRHP
jgi:hypothetical protein